MMEWKTVRLGEIISISSGQIYKGEFLGTGKNLLLGMGCVSFKEKFLYSGARQYSGDCADSKIARPGDIVLATRQQSDNLPILAMPAYIPSDLVAEKVIVGSNLYKVNIIDGSFDSRFVYWLMKTPDYVNYISSVKTGTTVKMITKSDVENYTFRCPPVGIRQKISDTLWTLDDKIENNRRINKNLEEQAQALFKSWFVECEANHETTSLSEYAEINPTRKLSKGTMAKCIDMASLSTTDSFPTKWESLAYNGGMKFCNSDTIMARITPCLENGKAAFINCLEEGEIAYGSTEYIVLSPKEKIAPFFLYCLVRNEDFISYAVKHMNGSSGRQRVSGESIGNYQLPKLDMKKMAEFYRYSEPLANQIKENGFESRRLAQLRDTLLPKLMNGEIEI